MLTETAAGQAGSLVATPAPYLTETPAPPPPVPPDAPTILLVEDSSIQRRLVHRLLEAAGTWHILHAVDGADALAKIAVAAPSAVLTDMYMPNMNGLALVEAVREKFPHVPVVIMTGNGSEQIAVAALKAGAADYVPKAAMANDLGPVLERVLAAAQAHTRKLRLLTGLACRTARFVLDNDPGLVSPLINQFREDMLVVGLTDQTGATRVGIALEEALCNAIYHGNLEVSSELRRNGDAPFHAEVKARRTQDRYRHRRVTVVSRVTPRQATFLVADQGPGFDVAKLPDPTDPANLDKPGGRGVMLMRAFMDDVVYNATGNSVRMVKRKDS